jgi:hypothetical protein
MRRRDGGYGPGAADAASPRRLPPHLIGITCGDIKEELVQDHRTESAYWALRLVFGIVPIVAGLDKFTNLLADWQGYLSPLAVRMLPVSPAAWSLPASKWSRAVLEPRPAPPKGSARSPGQNS